MYIDYTAWESFEYKITSLNLDLNNPRIKYRGVILNQTQAMKYLIEKEKVYELAKKISEEGYFVGEEPIICIENNKKVVLEGNRRTAALKLLQDPKKYLSRAKSNTLLQNVLKNNFPVDRRLKCYISPNRLMANPIIYERHNGTTLHKWKTGNQYAFVAEMYYEDGLTIEDICKVLNESRGKIIQPLRAYNLFYEGQAILEKEDGIHIDISDFEITNLERFFNYEPARKLIGVDFDNENGELIITLPQEEFEKRFLAVFRILLDSERFSRDFNNDRDKKRFVDKLALDSNFDLNIELEETSIRSRASEKRSDLEVEKNTTTHRTKKRSKHSSLNLYIIQRNKEIIFDNDKLEAVFAELKTLPLDKKYSFAVLLRTYLEQSLYFYIETNGLIDALSKNIASDNLERNRRKVGEVIKYLQGKYKITEDINSDELMSILKFNTSKEYTNTSLKVMLDYIMSTEISTFLKGDEYKSLKDYVERIKSSLDLTIHNLNAVVDIEYNRNAWHHLEQVFDYLSLVKEN